VARVTKAASHRVSYGSYGGLSEEEIALLYAPLIHEAESQFGQDVSFLADILASEPESRT
jgi:hypothetical protein